MALPGLSISDFCSSDTLQATIDGAKLSPEAAVLRPSIGAVRDLAALDRR